MPATGCWKRFVYQYGQEKLVGCRAGLQVRDRHLDWFVVLADHAWGRRRLQASDQVAWAARLAEEVENLWMCAGLEQGRWAAVREAGYAHRRYGIAPCCWNLQGLAREGQRWLEDLLEWDGRCRAEYSGGRSCSLSGFPGLGAGRLRAIRSPSPRLLIASIATVETTARGQESLGWLAETGIYLGRPMSGEGTVEATCHKRGNGLKRHWLRAEGESGTCVIEGWALVMLGQIASSGGRPPARSNAL